MGEDKSGNGKDNRGRSWKGKEKAEEAHHEGRSSPSGDGRLSDRILNSAAGLSSSLLGSSSTTALRSEGAGLGKGRSGPESSAGRATADQKLVHHVAGGKQTNRLRLDDNDASERGFGDFIGNQSNEGPHRPAMIPSLNDDAPWPSTGDYAVERQEARDGEEVAGLLSDTMSIRFTDNVDFGLSSAQLPRLRAALFGQQAAPSSDWDNLLNFWPIADAHLAPVVSDPNARSTWLSQWKDVLTGYSDEVWGELALDARHAEEEVNAVLQAESEADAGELKSLRRLAQVLAHIRGT
jgi:hypothetical protein